VRELLRIPNARIYLVGDVVSTLGDSALWLAMAIWMKELTGSSARAGLVMFCYVIGNLASPLGGAVADRFRRRPLLIWSNLSAGALVLLILLVHHRSEVWLVYLVIFVYGVIGSVIGPAQNALLPALVPAGLLGAANAAQQTLNQGLRLVTPLVGAGLFALVGAGAVAEIDAATFLIAVICLLALRVSEERPGRLSDAGGGRRLTAGFRFIRSQLGYHADPADFIQAQARPGSNRSPAAWTWNPLPPPSQQRGSTREASPYREYRVQLAGRPLPEALKLTARFLTQAHIAATQPGSTPAPPR